MAHRNEIPTATPYFEVEESGGTNADAVTCNRKPEFQDGGRKTQAAITFERLDITMRFQLLLPHFRPGPTWI